MEKQNLLIVEDDPNVGESIRLLLKKRGYSIFLASNGKEALHLFRQKAIDLVITDLGIDKNKDMNLKREEIDRVKEAVRRL